MPGNSGSFSPPAAPVGITQDNSTLTRRPDNTAFKQQRLPAWQPILTAKSVLPGFFIISLIFIPIGIVLLVSSNNILEHSFDYTNCQESDGTDCSSLRSNRSRMDENCTCILPITIDKDMEGTVFVYYGLTNFFQNHRRYVKSRDDVQLNGQSVTANSIVADCEPYRKVNDTYFYAPAGAIANSLFNDTFFISRQSTQFSIDLTGIAWKTDSDQKFNNPTSWANTVHPPYWQEDVNQLSLDPENNGYENEGLIVWMRTAAFPTFRKPYGRIVGGLPRGNYTVEIKYNYPVASFDGTKRFILSTTSWIGGKNAFLGIAYIVVGSFCLLTAVSLCIIHNVTKKNSTTAPR